MKLQDRQTVPESLANDNWYGYLQHWIYKVGVTWMEKTVSTPFWIGMTLFTMNRQKGGRRHLLHERMYQSSGRIAFKGQVFSAPMDWENMLEQLSEMEKQETHIALPKLGAVLASQVRISIEAGLVSLQGYIREATVRRNVVVQLIKIFKDAGHPDYTRINMKT